MNNSEIPKPIKSKLSQAIHGDSESTNYLAGAGGLNLAKDMCGLRDHHQLLLKNAKFLERANRVGYLGMGVDVDEIDPEESEDDDVNSSINLSGDTTHVYHLAPGQTPPFNQPQPEPKAKPDKPIDTQQPQQPSKGVPSWLPWVLMAAMGSAGGTYLMTKDSGNTVVTSPDTTERTIIDLTKGE